MMPLVIVRPEPGASATAEAARKLGLDPLVIPLFEIRAMEWKPPDPADFDALLFTSANALRHGGAGLNEFRGLPAYCVGEATAAVALEHGFEVARVGEGRVDGLLRAIPGELRLLHLCGLHRREPKDAPQAIVVVPVYIAEAIPAPDAFGAIDGAVIALHSPRAGARLAQLADEFGLSRERIALAAISTEAAEAAGAGWKHVESAPVPNDAALLAIAADLCKNPR